MKRLALLCTAALLALPAHAATISYPNFAAASDLQLNGSAAVVGDVLRLTPATGTQAGSAFSTTAHDFDADTSFNSFFSFNINGSGGTDGGADGIVFIVGPRTDSVGGTGGNLGYSGMADSLGVEFDTFQNGVDPDNNHVGIDVDGSNASLATATPSFVIETAATRYAWIDYDGTNDLLEVRLSESADRPADALLSLTIDLFDILGTGTAFVGFSAATGGGFANHDILSFEFSTGDDGAPVPEPAALGLFGLGVLALGRGRRRRSAGI